MIREVKALNKLRIRGLLRRGRATVTFQAPSAGTLGMTLSAGRKATVLASGRHAYPAAGRGTLTLKLSKKGKRLLRHARKAKTTLTASFTPRGGTATKVRRAVQLKR